MKKFLLFLLFCFSISLWAIDKNRILQIEEEKVEVKKRYEENQCGYSRSLSFAGFSTYFPFGWAERIAKFKNKEVLESKGVFESVFWDILKKLGANRYVYNRGYRSFQESYKALQTGKIDFFLGAYYDTTIYHPEVTLVYPSLFQNPFVVVFLKGNEKPVHSFEDLKGLKGVVRQEELVYPLVYKKVPKTTKLVRVSGSRNAYLKLLKGEVDFMLTSFYANEAEMRRFKLRDKLFVGDQALLNAEMFIFANKNSPCYEQLKDKISEVLKAYKQEKFIEKKVMDGVDQWGILFKDDPELTVSKPAQVGKTSGTTAPVVSSI